MKKMTSPTSWFGLRSKSSSKRSVSPISTSAPSSSGVFSLRSSTRSGQAQTVENLARRGAQLETTITSKTQGYPYQIPRAESRSVSMVQGETPRFSSESDTLQSNREELVKTYLSWINAHLKKRKDSEKVSDLSTALQDGVTLLDLARVLSGKEITGAVKVPKTQEDREDNVSRVLTFLLGEGLDVGALSSTQIMEGNLKHILKVIYTMACHYRGTPIQQTLSLTESHKVSLQSSPSVNEYANLKQQVNEFEKKLRGNALIEKYRRMSINSSILSDVETGGPGYETDDTVCDSEVNYEVCLHEVKPNCHKAEPIYVNVSLSQTKTKSDNDNDILRNSNTSSDLISTADSVLHTSKENGVKNRSVHVYSESTRDQILTPAVKQEGVELCFNDLSVTLSELSPIKQQIIEVQNVLRGSTEFSGHFPDVSSLQSRITELEMKLDDTACQLSESEEHRQKISSELSVVIQECTDLSVRLTESLSIRADVLRKDYLLQNSESENLSMRIAVREKNEVIKQLNVKFDLREQLLTTLEKQVSEFNREKERQIKGRVPVIGSHPTLSNLSEAHEVPAHLSTKVKEVCDVMFTLRARVSKDSACNQLMDSIEDALYAIVERLYYYAARSAKRSSREGRRGQSPRLSGRNQVSESPNSTLNRSSSSTNSLKADGTDLNPNELVVFDICQCPNTSDNQNSTRILCYVDQQQTPSRTTLHKHSSLVTLSDIKSQINKVGKFSYFFKVNDPDFGTVKEEVVNETDFVPIYNKNTVVVCLESNEV